MGFAYDREAIIHIALGAKHVTDRIVISEKRFVKKCRTREVGYCLECYEAFNNNVQPIYSNLP